jgi:hypothetical protein
LSWRDLAEFREEGGAELYRLCLAYGQQLWLDGLPARSLLAVDRALYCDVAASAEVLQAYPLPYAAIRWLVSQPSDAFTGNARVHYQHLADRVRGERADIKKWRAWAAWAVTRQARPDLPGDPKHAVTEPTHAEIAAGLHAHGIAGEASLWRECLGD